VVLSFKGATDVRVITPASIRRLCPPVYHQ